jgi:hypothetical protein
MDQHEETKRMLDLIRESKNKNKGTGRSINLQKLISEQTTKLSDDKDLEPIELKEEERKFRDIVTPRVKFNRFKLYPKAQNVEFSGKFTDNNVEWFYSLDDSRGVYITSDLLQLNDTTLKQIQKLVAYYETWSNEWANKIAEEYNNKEEDNLEPPNPDEEFNP